MTTRGGSGKRFLLTGGRAPATLELARLLRGAGHRVYVAESLPVHLCRSSRDVERCFDVPPPVSDEEGFVDRLRQIIREQHIDYLIPTCEEVFYIARAYDRLSGCCVVFTSPIALMRSLHSKWEFIALLRSGGLHAPDSWLIRREQELHSVLREIDPEARMKWVLKREFSRFSSKVVIFTGNPPAPLRIKEGESWVLQRFVEGRQICTFAVASEGRMGAYAAYAAEFTAGMGASISFVYEPDPDVLLWMKRFVALTGFTGFIALDMILGEDGRIHPIECNPRLTSGIHLFRAGDGIDKAIMAADRRRGATHGLDEPASIGRRRGAAHGLDVHGGTDFRWTRLCGPDAPAAADLCGYASPHSAQLPACGASQEIIVPKSGHSSMIALAMLLYGLPQVRSMSGLGRWLRRLLTSRDVLFRWRDPLPFLGQLGVYGAIWRISRRMKITPLEASTADIEWNGEP